MYQNHRQDDGTQKNIEKTIKKAEFTFMVDLKSLIANSATEAEHNWARVAIRLGGKNTELEQYRPIFGKSNVGRIIR